jgi:two-component system response regulator FixJ
MVDRRVIHIVDDEDAIRRSAGFLLKTSGFAVESWHSGVAFLKEVRHAAPGCILLDMRMPEMDGLEVQQALIERGVAMPVIMLTGHADVSIAVRAMRAGAIDFIEKPFEKAVVLAAIENAFAWLIDKDGRANRAREASVVLAGLTPSEREVLEGLAQGLSNQSIAHDLGLSPRAVEVHRANIMAKLGVRSLSEALRLAFAAGLGMDTA